MPKLTTLLQTLHHESGLPSLTTTGRDAFLIILARTSRMFAYGASSLVLALFFAELGFTDAQIGLFMTLTLLGDVVLSLVLTLVADGVGRRRTLVFGAGLMMVSGTVFALCEGFWVLLGAAVVGVISATGGDFGPFRAIEESMVSELTTPGTRADVLVWYVTLASLGSSVGTEMAGRIVEGLVSGKGGWRLVDAYHACFGLYLVMGGVSMACAMALSERCELRRAEPLDNDDSNNNNNNNNGETERLLGASEPSTTTTTTETPPAKRSWTSQISRDSLSIMSILWFLLMVDSLADGMANMSLTTYYTARKFPHLPKSALGDIVSTSYLLAALSNIFAGPLARHIGLVNTMVFTHIPSSAAVLVFPLAQTVPLTFGLLLLRVGLNNMDQAPRAALIAAVVRAEERTAVMGITSVVRTVASMTGPSITGVLAGGGRFWIAFVVAGGLRLAYDLGVFAMFVNIRLYKHETVEETQNETREEGEQQEA
ncbi:major facilitator superfamily domain-containing protein [Dichotomopilus funicola]|uniref:Major facilitator superfamily domain-containing protein n=1 Tax=Dichotomopilus funicola TaxID=1934379 RepID=A0AAN6UZQ1_9PEZI|nr:major facilitator superfamily domain-containing protein [Dichotomopilus funicola]